jgi:hypothetical protein
MSPSSQRLIPEEEVGGAIPFLLVVLPPWLAG